MWGGGNYYVEMWWKTKGHRGTKGDHKSFMESKCLANKLLSLHEGYNICGHEAFLKVSTSQNKTARLNSIKANIYHLIENKFKVKQCSTYFKQNNETPLNERMKDEEIFYKIHYNAYIIMYLEKYITEEIHE